MRLKVAHLPQWSDWTFHRYTCAKSRTICINWVGTCQFNHRHVASWGNSDAGKSSAIDNATDASLPEEFPVAPVGCSSAQQGKVTGLKCSAASVEVLKTDTFTKVCCCKYQDGFV